MEETQITMICLNGYSEYKKGKLLLPLPFYVDYGDDLPEEVKLHVPTGKVWMGRYVKGSAYIEGLDEMMVYYGIKPYHLTLLDYKEDGDFRVKFYTQYAVEMQYPVDGASYPHDLSFNPIEVDKLYCTFKYNACRNFVGVYDLLVEKDYLLVKSNVKVLSQYGCSQLGLSESVIWLTLCFEQHEWRIKLKWVNGDVFFGRQWFNFVEAANVLDGDILSFQKTGIPSCFKVAVLDKEMKHTEAISEELAEFSPTARFFKVLTNLSLSSGELELPTLFKRTYGESLNGIIEIDLGGGYSTKFKYCRTTSKIYDLKRFLRKYEIEDGYVIFFDYVGLSKFSVAVYDSQCMNHFRDVIGFIRLADYLAPPNDVEVVELLDSDKSDMDVVQSDDSSDETDEGEEDVLIDEFLSFTVILKRSNVDQTSHGAYIPCNLWSVCRNWGKRTAVRLMVGARNWDVQVIRNKRSFRFGIGWDAFTQANDLAEGNQIAFQYIGNNAFRVTV